MESQLDPRNDQDNMGIMICFHRRYALGDKHSYSIEQAKKIAKNSTLCLPIYMYDHGGITISTKPYSCPWDSGQLGFIYTTMERVTAFWGKKALNKSLKAKVLKALENEVSVYDDYLVGR